MSESFRNIPDLESASWKGPVDDFASLPTDATEGDARVTLDTGSIYVYYSGTWVSAGGGSPVTSVNGQVGAVLLDTDDIPEGSNLYFTNERAQDAVGSILTDTASIDLTYNDAGNTITADLTVTTVSAGSYGSVSQVVAFTVDTQGRLTSASNVSIQIAESQVTNLVSDLAGKQPTGNYVTSLTGDVTGTGPGATATTLATVNSNVGSFGTSSSVSTVTVNAKGLVTAASNTAIQIAESQVTNLVSDLAGKQATGNYITALTGDATASGPGSAALTLATVATPGTYTSVTVNAKGLVTAGTSGPTAVTVVNKTANYTIVSGDLGTYFTLDTLGGAFNLTLPTPSAGFIFRMTDSTGNFGTNNLTLVRAGSENISGIAASKVFQTNWGGWTVFSNGTDWFVI